MGVMSCSKKGCNNILCSTYIDDVGYVCQDCQDAFKKYLEKNSIIVKTEGDIVRELKKFISLYKDCEKEDSEVSVHEFFSRNTKYH